MLCWDDKVLIFFSINLAPVELMVLTVLFPGVAARGNFELFRACSVSCGSTIAEKNKFDARNTFR